MIPTPLLVSAQSTTAPSTRAVVGVATTLAEYVSAFFMPSSEARSPDGMRHHVVLGTGHPHSERALSDSAAIEPWDRFQARLPAPFRRGGAGAQALDRLLDDIGAGRLRRRHALGRVLVAAEAAAAGDAGNATTLLLAAAPAVHDDGTLPPADGDTIAVRDDDYLWCGALLAHRTGRRLLICDDLHGLPRLLPGGRCASLTLVAEPAAFSVARIARLLGWDGAPACAVPWGILSARTLPALSHLVVRGQLARGRPAAPSLSVVETEMPLRSTPGHELVRWSALSRSRLERMTSEDHAVICLTSHGDAIDANLNQGVLCGRSSGTQRAAGGTVIHTCQTDGFCRRDADGGKLRLPIDHLRCQVLFNETCSGIALTDGIFPADLTLALSAIEGAPCAYLSSAKIVRATGHGPLLVQALLHSGRTFGEVAAAFAAFHRAVTGDVASYLLLGDAAGRLSSVENDRGSAPPSIRVEWLPDGRAATIVIEGMVASAVEISLRSTAAEALADGGRLAIGIIALTPAPGGDPEPVFATAIPWLAGAPLTVVVFACRPVRVERLALRIAADDTHHAHAREILRQLGSHLPLLAHIADKAGRRDGLRDTPQLRRQAQDLETAVAMGREAVEHGAALARLGRAGVVHSGQAPWPSLWSAFHHLLLEGDRFLAERWPTWHMTHYIAPFYAGRLRAEDRELAGRSCYLCGSPCFAVTMHNETEDHLTRVITCCCRCGMLSDRPRDQPAIEISGPGEAAAGSSCQQAVGIGNPGDTPRSFGLAMTFEGQLPWLSATIAPAHRSSMVAPHARLDESFEVSIGARSSPGVYQLIVFCSSRLGISVSTKPFVVTR